MNLPTSKQAHHALEKELRNPIGYAYEEPENQQLCEDSLHEVINLKDAVEQTFGQKLDNLTSSTKQGRKILDKAIAQQHANLAFYITGTNRKISSESDLQNGVWPQLFQRAWQHLHEYCVITKAHRIETEFGGHVAGEVSKFSGVTQNAKNILQNIQEIVLYLAERLPETKSVVLKMKQQAMKQKRRQSQRRSYRRRRSSRR